MNGNGNGKLKAVAVPQGGVPMIGQPFTVKAVGIPVNVAFTCHCPGGDPEAVLEILLSEDVTCPACGTVYTAVYDVATKTVQFGGRKPKPAAVV